MMWRDIRDLIAWMLSTAASRIGTERYVRTMLADAAKIHAETEETR